jgi:hypothetical protein
MNNGKSSTNKNRRTSIERILESNESSIRGTVFEGSESYGSILNPNHFESQIESVATTHSRIQNCSGSYINPQTRQLTQATSSVKLPIDINFNASMMGEVSIIES